MGTTQQSTNQNNWWLSSMRTANEDIGRWWVGGSLYKHNTQQSGPRGQWRMRRISGREKLIPTSCTWYRNLFLLQIMKSQQLQLNLILPSLFFLGTIVQVHCITSLQLWSVLFSLHVTTWVWCCDKWNRTFSKCASDFRSGVLIIDPKGWSLQELYGRWG